MGARWKIQEPTQIPSELDYAWTAGFIEGDGSIYSNKSCFYIEITQKQKWPLDKLLALFGGSVGVIHKQGINKQDYFRWRVSGKRARDLFEATKAYYSPEKLNYHKYE